MMAITAAPGHCQYSFAPTTVETLDSLSPMSGRLGRVVTSPNELTENPETLEQGIGLEPLDTHFLVSGNSAYPQDYPSLFAATLYKALESVYLLFARLDPAADLATMVTDLPDTRIVYQAHYEKSNGKEYRDNAAYTAIQIKNNGQVVGEKNYIFSFPIEEVSEVPLGVNPFIVAHESTHFVNRYLWKKYLNLSDTTTKNVAGAIDEGTADYGGFMVTGDPGGFLCSFPSEGRDLAVPKTLSGDVPYDVSSAGYPIHNAGAVWAYSQYQIGQAIGHEENMRALIRAFSNCVRGSSTLTYSKVIQCHLSALGSRSSTAQQIYSRTFAGGS